MAKTLITVEQAAKYAGVGERTIRRWQERGRLTRYKVPATGENLVDQKELDRLFRPVAQDTPKS